MVAHSDPGVVVVVTGRQRSIAPNGQRDARCEKTKKPFASRDIPVVGSAPDTLSE